MRISDWSSDVCSSDLPPRRTGRLSTPGTILARFAVWPASGRPLVMLRSATPIVRNDDAAMSKNTSIRDVLAVVDGTASSLTGVDQAVAYAGLYDAALTIVVVTENLALAAAIDPMASATAMEVSDAPRQIGTTSCRERVWRSGEIWVEAV